MYGFINKKTHYLCISEAVGLYRGPTLFGKIHLKGTNIPPHYNGCHRFNLLKFRQTARERTSEKIIQGLLSAGDSPSLMDSFDLLYSFIAFNS
jgi:hypothetical protein